jgi:hypothetical protein
VISNEVLLAIIAIVAAVASAWAYGYKKEQDRKTLELQRQIDDAKHDAETNQSTLNLMSRMMTRMEQESDRANEERKAWVQVVERNEVAKTRLADNVQKNTEATTGNTTAVGAMQQQFDQFKGAVGEQFATFKRQLDSGLDGLSEEKLGARLDAAFDRFIARVQGVIVHPPALDDGEDDTLRLSSIPVTLTGDLSMQPAAAPEPSVEAKGAADEPKPE